MRLIISAALLLASTAAMPALAQDNPQGDPRAHQGDGGHHDGDRHGDGQRGGGQPQGRGAPPQGGNADRGPQGGPQQAPGRPGPQGGPQQAPGRPGPQGGGDPRGPQGGRPDGRGPDGRGPADQGNRPGWANQPGAHGGEGGYRPDGGYNGGRPDGGYDRGRPGGGYQQGRPNGGGGGDWNRGWRGDQRYNWQGYRDSHRDAYRIGRYRPPSGYGWGYRRYGIGAALEAGFFGRDYWIGNPGYYRLPPAYGPYRWVRYYNDALLVNVYNGYIADEIPDFFW